MGYTDTIKIVRISVAELLEHWNKIGQVKVCFVADIIALRGNPLTDITVLQNVDFVMRAGMIYKQRVLNKTWGMSCRTQEGAGDFFIKILNNSQNIQSAG
jgi:hypothetical protein